MHPFYAISLKYYIFHLGIVFDVVIYQVLSKVASYYIKFIFIGLGLILFSALFKIYYEDKDWAVQHQADHFQDALNEIDKHLITELDHYISVVDTGGLVSLLDKGVDYHKSLEEKGIGVYIYADSNLKFWSTNKLVVPSVNVKTGLRKELSGYFLTQVKRLNEAILIAQFLIKKEYAFENSYVRNDFDEKLYLQKGWELHEYSREGSIPISVESSKQTFYISPNNLFESPNSFYLMALEIAGLLLFLLGCILMAKHLSLIKRLIFLPGLLLLVRIILLVFEGPINLYSLEIFNPKLLAFSSFIPSLGDFLLFVVFLLVLAFSILKHTNLYHHSFEKRKLLVFFIGFAIIHFITLAIVETVEGLVMFSEIPLDLSHILSIEYTTLIALFCIGALIASYLLIIWKLIVLFHDIGIKLHQSIGGFGLLMAFLSFLGASLGFADAIELLWAIPVFSLITYSYYENGKVISFSVSISLLFFFSLMITQSLRDYTEQKTIGDKKLLLSKLSKDKDMIAEYLFQGLQTQIKSDDNALNVISDFSISDQDIYKFFKKRYFNGFWDKFDLQVNPCFEGDSIVLLNQEDPVSCDAFFKGIIQSVGTEVSPGLYHLENGNGRISYLGTIDFGEGKKVYLELDSKFKPDGVGFPTLLLGEQVERKSLNPEYAFAHFKSGELVKQKGAILYSSDLKYYNINNDLEWGFIEKDGVGHLIRLVDKDVYFLSQKITNTWDQMAFYSYLFAFFSILTIIAVLCYRFLYQKANKVSSFKTRFQSVIIFILFFSTVFIGVGSVYYLKNQYNEKNFDAISEKIKSVQIEVESKFGGNDDILKIDSDYVDFILEKFSKVFFTDINLYDPNGQLVSSSQNQIFQEGLVGDRMDPLAMYEMLFNAQSQFVQIEEIEGMQFLSAYVPFYNKNGSLMAYLNLPYFARSNDLKNEISNFIVALLNIYALLIVIALVIGLILTNRITEPLKLIQEKMANIQLGQSNEPINYEGNDEIGTLINEYNRMIIEITESARRLAESEREDAWREMAKQVAHEIKNPLTPMKLSIQHLQMRWNSFDEEEKSERFASFGKNLIQQIDTLSAIATEFSSFAKLPETAFTEINLTEIIRSSVDVYDGTDNVKVTFDYSDELKTNGDKDQMLRVFNNLIKNAIQAIPEDRDGLVSVLVEEANGQRKIIVSDNGKGISKENEGKIFVPNFTTKNSGMGLGLAMVQKIIENMEGRIYFQSEEGVGTQFIIELP